MMILLPVVIGLIMEFPAGWLLKRARGQAGTLAVLLAGITLTVGTGWLINTKVLSGITLNYMLMGVSFSAVFTNMVGEERLAEITDCFHLVPAVSLLAARPELVGIVQRTIAAAAVINKIIAVIAAKKGFQLAGEIETR